MNNEITRINALLLEVQEQRNKAQNDTARMAGEIAILREENETLKAKIEELEQSKEDDERKANCEDSPRTKRTGKTMGEREVAKCA